MKMNKAILCTALVLALGTALFFIPVGEHGATPENASVKTVIEPMPPPEVEAKAALAVDLLAGKELFDKNPEVILPLASITKVVSMLTIMDLAELSEKTEISRQTILVEKPSSLVVGEHLTVRDLMTMAMVESSNDAVAALVEYAAEKYAIPVEQSVVWFLSKMHGKTESLGVRGMLFYDFIGLDINDTLAGAYGSARNILDIVKKESNSLLWQLGAIREVVSEEGIVHRLNPTNALAPELGLLVGAKTGFTDIAGGNLLVIVEYPLGRPIGIVVLGSSEEGRFRDVKAILDWIKAVHL